MPSASPRSGGRSVPKPVDPELLTRTSWVNAKVAYDQVKKGKALGNSCALWLRWQVQKQLFHLGCFIQKHSGKVLFLGLVFLSLFCIGLKTASLETNVEKLWVEEGGRLQHELEYTEAVLGVGSGATHEIVIQTPAEGAHRNVLTVPSMLQHYKVLQAATKVNIHIFDVTWKLKDLCFATNFPSFDDDSYFDRVLQNFIPCMIITPLDCFWEGSKLLGPEWPIFVPQYHPSVTWANLNPSDLVESLRTNPDINFPAGDQVAELLQRAGITSGYQEKPCLDPHDIECPTGAPNWESKQLPDVAALVDGGCSGFAAKYMTWQEDLIIGGVHKNKTGHITRAESMQSMIVLMGEHELYEYHKETTRVDGIEWTQDKAKTVLEEWQRKFTMEVIRVMQSDQIKNISRPQPPDQILPFATTSLLDLLHDFSEISYQNVIIGYLLMVVYACAVLLRLSDMIHSQSGVGVAGVLLVALSVAAGLGLTCVIGLKFNASTTQIVPFLALGLGVNDMFLIAHTFAEHSRKDIPYHEQTGEALRRVGVSVLLTSLSVSCAFFLAAIIPIPALRVFCLQVGIVVLFNLVTMMIVFPAVVSLDLIRRNEQKVDIFCCITGHSPGSNNLRSHGSSPGFYEMNAHTAPWAGNLAPHAYSCMSQTQVDGSHPVTVLAAPEYDHYIPTNAVAPASSLPPSTTSSRQCLAPEEGITCREHCAHAQKDLCSWTLTRLAKSVYGPLLEKTCSKVFVTLGFIVLLILGVVGTLRVKDGLDITDVVPRDTNEYSFLQTQAKYFGFYNFYAVTQGDINYAEERVQRMLVNYHRAFLDVQNIIKDKDGTLPDFWLPLMKDWLLHLQTAFDKDYEAGCITQDRWYPNATAEGILGYKLLVQTGDMDSPIDKTRVLHGRLVSRGGIIFPPAFYCYVTAWTSNDALAYAASQADFRPLPREWYHDMTDTELKIPKSQPFVFAQLPFYLHNMGNTEEVTSMINEVRSICDSYTAEGLPNYPRGVPFTFWEQYIHLRFYLMLALLCVFIAIFIVITIILLNPWTAAIVVVVLGLMTVQLFGFMGLMDIKLSAVSAVILIMSTGIGVEFTVHITLGFLTSIGTRNKRMRVTLQHMFAPVLHGAITTLLGVVMLATTKFDFIFKYFFVVLSALIVIGVLNGLVLLPVLLSMFGPNPEVKPVDRADHIQPPTPEPSPPPPAPRSSSQRTSLGRRVQPYRVPSEISLTTITEEPTQYSSQDSHISVHVHPEVVVETSMPAGTNANVSVNGNGSHRSGFDSNSSSSSNSSRNTTPPESIQCTPTVAPRAVTKVKATTKVKVEVHAPLPGMSSDQEYKSRRRKTTSSSVPRSAKPEVKRQLALPAPPVVPPAVSLPARFPSDPNIFMARPAEPPAPCHHQVPSPSPSSSSYISSDEEGSIHSS